MPSKPEISQPDSIRGDVTLDPFQLDSLRPLLEEHELQIKAHFDEKMEQLSRMLSHSFGILVGSGGRARPDFDHDLPVHRVASSGPSGRRTSTGGALSVSLGPEAELGLKAGVAPHLVQLIERVKASHEVKAPIFSSTRSLSRRNAVELCRSFMGLYEYLVDFMVLVYALCLGAEIHYTSLNRSEPAWVRPMEIGFCVMFGVDLLIRFCLEGRLFFMGSRRWWNLLDTLSLTMLIVALLEGSRTLGNLSAFVRVGRILRLARCLWTFKNALAKWTHLRQLRVLITSMTESTKIMIWLVLLVLSFNYVYGLVLTESIWTSCPNVHTPVLCEKFGSLLSTMMTLYQIQYSGLLWGTLWDEVAALDWYFPAAFLSYIVFALMILVNTITSFICSLQGTVSKRERDLLIDNEMEYNERLVRQLYTIFQDFDQNGNGAISWAEFQLALEDERMHAFLAALELDMSDAVKVFQILASDKTGAIEESDFLLGCLRLRGGATAVDMVRIQMEQEWIHSALLQMKGLMQKTAKDLAAVQFTLAAQESVRPTSHFSRQKTSVVADGARDGDDTASDSSVEVLHHYQRTNLKTFERAVTVEELSGILDELPQVCHGWKDAHTGDVISEKKLNLYQFNYHYIMPKTAPQEGVLLQWPASCAKGLKALPKAGQEVCQRCSGMALPKARATVLRAQLEVEDDVEKLNVWVCLLRGHFVNMSSEVLFDEEDELPASDMSVIARNSISYKELLSSEACLPVWYCTHWWGEPLHSFILCCQEHAILRRLGSSASYWVCGYANRQHELDLEIA
ncbi:unnamed protein product [Durusdinium trenchii]|uniref:EF-hand domain-containing protein n=1 Tax=Durusdinium trenchii TaxID=1381693 RepID=A0ABP0IC75_9DINO